MLVSTVCGDNTSTQFMRLPGVVAAIVATVRVRLLLYSVMAVPSFVSVVTVSVGRGISLLLGLRTCKCLQRPILCDLACSGADGGAQTHHLREMDPGPGSQPARFCGDIAPPRRKLALHAPRPVEHQTLGTGPF